jgi:hypothetical protein
MNGRWLSQYFCSSTDRQKSDKLRNNVYPDIRCHPRLRILISTCDTSNPLNTFVNKMSIRKAKSAKPRKTAAKKAGKKAMNSPHPFPLLGPGLRAAIPFASSPCRAVPTVIFDDLRNKDVVVYEGLWSNPS